MQLLVTGGAGFIGANVVRTALARGCTVTVLDDLSTGYKDNLVGRDCTFIEGSILNEDDLHQAVQGQDAIIHLAAVPSVPRSVADPVTSHNANATGTLRVLEAARQLGVQHISVASSSSVYGANLALPKVETMMPSPVSPYAVSKLATESYAISYGRVFNLPTIAFRFFNVFGPLQAAGHAYAAVVPTFLHQVMRNQPVTVHGDGHQTRDFTYVDSVCRVLLDAAERKVTCDSPVNLAFGGRRNLHEVLAEISTITGRQLEVEHTASRPGDVRDSQADPTLLHSLFPDVHPVDFEVGLRETISWFSDKY